MEPIKSIMIVEMIGRPKEHLESTVREYIKKMGSEKGVKIINEKHNEAKIIEHKKPEEKEIKTRAELFSTFAEIETEIKDIETLMQILLVYMPSHIEIISPESINIDNIELNGFFNEVIRKMHEYDGIAKSMIMQNKIIKEQFQEIIEDIRKPTQKVEENAPKGVESIEEKSDIKENKPKKSKKKEKTPV